MKKMILLMGAVVMLVAAPAPASSSKTVPVDISAAGFVPANVTAQTGDTVVWTNKDTANHQVVCATCPFTSAVIPAGQTASFTFTKVGKFGVVDPLNKNKKGTITVNAAPATLTVAAAPRTLNYVPRRPSPASSRRARPIRRSRSWRRRAARTPRRRLAT